MPIAIVMLVHNREYVGCTLWGKYIALCTVQPLFQFPNDVFNRYPCTLVSRIIGLILRVGWGQDVDSNQYPNDVFKRCPCSPVSGTVGLILRVGWGQDVDSNQYPNDVFKRCPCSPVSGTVGLILRVGWGQHVDSYPKTHAHM